MNAISFAVFALAVGALPVRHTNRAVVRFWMQDQGAMIWPSGAWDTKSQCSMHLRKWSL